MGIRVYGWRPTTSPGGATGVFANPAGYTHHTIISQEFNEASPVAGRIIAMGSWTGSLTDSLRSKKWAAYLTNTYNAAGNYPYLGETEEAILPTINYTAAGGGSDVNAPINPDTVIAARASKSGHILVNLGDKLMIAGLDLDSGGSKKTAIGRSHPNALGIPAGSRMLNSQEATNNFDMVFSPTNPNGIVAAGYRWALYALIEENRAPSFGFTDAGLPVATTPTGEAAVFASEQPKFSIQFSDLDRLAGYNDYPKEMIVSIYRWTGTTWAFEGETSYQAGVHYPIPTDAADEPIIQVQAPAGLSLNETYRAHVRGRDELNVWSPSYSNTPSSWLSQLEFSLAEGGYVSNLTPDTKITTLTPDFTATYDNEEGFYSATVQVRLLTRSGSGSWAVSQESDVLAKVAAPGSPILVEWEETGFVDLLPTTDYAIEWQVVDSEGTVGPWSGRRSFHTNYRPLQPTGMNPSNNAQLTTAPLITFLGTDPDDTPIEQGGNLAAFVEITGPYIVNGTFDVNKDGWTNVANSAGLTSTRERATDQVRTGAGSFKFDITANTDTPGTTEVYTALHPVVEGYSYTASAWRRLGAANLRAHIGIHWYDETSTYISSSLSAIGSTTVGAWSQSVINDTAPAGATQMRIFLRAMSMASGAIGAVWFDDVVVNSGARALKIASFNPLTNRWSVQSDISSDVAAAGLYSYRARTYDGDLYSTWSSPSSFTMSVGPEVDVISPTPLSVSETTRPLIEWEVTGVQNSYRVIIRDNSTGVEVYNSGRVFDSVARSHLVPSAILKNLDDLNVQVVVTNLSDQFGYSAPIRFLIEYPEPPAPADLSINYEYLWADDDPSAIRLSWTPVDTASDILKSIEIWRAPESDESQIKLIATFSGYDPGTYIDKSPKSGVLYRYYVRQVVIAGAGEVNGASAQIDGLLNINASILEVVGAEETDRIVMRFWSGKNKTLTQQQNFAIPAGGGDYVESLGFGTGRDFSITWQVVDADKYGGMSGMTAREQLDNFERIFDSQHIYSYRDGLGNQEYVRINGNPAISYKNTGSSYADVTVPLRRIAYDPEAMVDEN